MDGGLNMEPALQETGVVSARRGQAGPWWLVLWLAIPLLVWWSLREVDFAQVWGTLGHLGLPAMLILVMLNLSLLALFASRWWLILHAQGYRRAYISLVGYRLAGFGITYFTPGTQLGGEPLQVYLLQRREKVPSEVALASVGLDKLLELIANFTFLLAGVSIVLLSGLGGPAIGTSLLALPIALLAVPFAYLGSLWLGKRPASVLAGWLAEQLPGRRWLNGLSRLAPATEAHMAQFFQRHPGHLLLALLFSLVIWLVLIGEFALTLRFLGLQLSLPQVMLALTAARLAFLLPLPAGLGSLEAGQVMAMGLLGMNPAVGISLSLVIRVRDILFGGAGLWLGGILSR
jgi:hypothetical protein